MLCFGGEELDLFALEVSVSIMTNRNIADVDCLGALADYPLTH
jgi:hypothetical protein